MVEGSGISCVAVKCVDIGRNTNGEGTHVINMPHIHDVLAPILYTIPLQLLSYYVAVLQNVYAEELVHQALPKAKVDQYDSVDLMYQAVNSGRADAAATDQSSVKYLMVQNPGRYRSPTYAWSPQTYACAVKRGDQDWLNFVNTALHEAMTGVEFPTYKASFKQWFGVDLPEPAIGFPVEFK